ncbi:MAG TPA: HEAT repeat domain-containing protein [Planctomycetota bacterium]|jgi:HEAT repeat protein|nr:HEAT repeat domain-containing protein [Planctomycetota bacterium]
MILTLTLLLALLPQDDAAAKAALDAYKSATLKSKDAKSHVDAVAELAKTPHESVAAKLASLLTTEVAEVRIAAATALSSFKTPPELKLSASKYLVQALTAGANAKETEVRVAILGAIGALQEETAANAIKSHFDDKDPKIACAALAAAGALHSKTLIEPLIQVVRESEKIANGGALPPPPPPPGKGKTTGKPPPPPPNQKDTDKEKKDRANMVNGAAESALTAVTQQNFRTADEWEKWWSKNRSTFTPK